MATASVSWASFEIEPYDIAPVANRFTISFAGSTSSSGIGCVGPLEVEQAAEREQLRLLLVDELLILPELLAAVDLRGPLRALATTSGASTWASPLRRQA